MYPTLKGMRVVEGASFIAAPSCCLHLAQMGAEVIRFDAIGGGPDCGRWPRAPGGASLYWEGLNKGKKSLAVDLSRPEGRDLAVAVATAPGDEGGLFVTNYPVRGFLSHERLARKRPDLITVRVAGWADGRNGVDYTINAVTGFPAMTGPDEAGAGPVNHVLPAWDLLTGAYAAFALLAKERERRTTSAGGEIVIPLSDVAAATLGHLGQIAEVTSTGRDRPRTGNNLFGAFGRDFRSRDGRSVMLVAITPRQWSGLVAALGLTVAVEALEGELGVSFAADEGLRFEHRERLNALVATAVAGRDAAELLGALEAAGGAGTLYRGTLEAVREEPGFVADNPIFRDLLHPSGLRYPTPGAAATLVGEARETAKAAPRLGEHTDEILGSVLGLPDYEISRLHDAGIVAGPSADRKA